MDKFDIFNYFNFFKKIELLKKFVLDKNQNILIDLMSNKQSTNYNDDDFARKIKSKEFKEIISSIDIEDKINKNILEEIFEFTIK